MKVVALGLGAAIACALFAAEAHAQSAQPAPAVRFGKLEFDTPPSARPRFGKLGFDDASSAFASSRSTPPSAPAIRIAKLGFELEDVALAEAGSSRTAGQKGPFAGGNDQPLQASAERNVRLAAAETGPKSVFDALPASWTPAAAAPAFAAPVSPPGALFLLAQNVPAAPGGLPTTPVGEAPEMMELATEVTALPEGARVLTPARRLVMETSYEYGLTSSNRLIFRGVEIVPGILLGLIDANDVVRDTVVAALSLRYGIMDRWEIEARIPAVYRHDRFTVLSQQVSPTIPSVQQTFDLDGRALGDIEFGIRYQLNRATRGGAIFVGGIRAKTATGIGPYDVDFDENGVSTELGTGSGFWAVEPSLTMLYPSDPVVIFVTVGYLHSFGQDIDRNIGTTHIGDIEPGGAIHTSVGFGFALNPEFSFSLGFSNTFIFGTRSEIGALETRSNSVEAASLTMGMSYVFSPALTLGANFEFGVTQDAPDMRVLIRIPFRF